MIDFTTEGDYTYQRDLGGNAFTLAGHLAGGDFVVP